MPQLVTSCVSLKNGAAEAAGVGKKYRLEVTNDGSSNFIVGDHITLDFVHTITALVDEVGFGLVSNINPQYCFTYGDKVYVLSSSTVYFSSSGVPTEWNDPNSRSAGFVDMSNFFRSPETLKAIAPYQGRLAFFSRYTTQIWTVNADPALWVQNQVLQDIGTLAPLSVRALGELDVFFLSDTGIRSLRVRDNTLNAYVDDIGSPVDQIVQSVLLSISASTASAACGIVEPNSGRYWLFLNDTIYVFSNFLGSKIRAWARYNATYSNAGVQTAFVPQKFVVFNGQVYCRDAAALYIYGGSNNNTYDNVVCTVESPWLDLKSPGTMKSALGIDVALDGAWTISLGMDLASGLLQQAYVSSDDSFPTGIQPFSANGTHYKWKAITTGSTTAKLSELIFHYQADQEK
jgi:hypothetical protein